MKTGCIYRIYNILNGKSYIGKSTDGESRISRHFAHHSSPTPISLDISKYGKEHFRSEILYSDIPIDQLDKMEILNIRFWNSRIPNGYNQTDGGKGITGFKHSDETREKIRVAITGKKHTKEARQKMSEFQSNRTAEHHAKIVAASRGRTHSVETREKISELMRGDNNPMKRPEVRAKFGESRRGDNNPMKRPEVRAKNAAAQRGRKDSLETRRRKSESARKAHARRKQSAQ